MLICWFHVGCGPILSGWGETGLWNFSVPKRLEGRHGATEGFGKAEGNLLWHICKNPQIDKWNCVSGMVRREAHCIPNLPGKDSSCILKKHLHIFHLYMLVAGNVEDRGDGFLCSSVTRLSPVLCIKFFLNARNRGTAERLIAVCTFLSGNPLAQTFFPAKGVIIAPLRVKDYPSPVMR